MKIKLKKPTAPIELAVENGPDIEAVEAVGFDESFQAIEKLFTPNQAADVLNVSPAFLAKDRNLSRRNKCPPRIPFVKIGAVVRYRPTILVAFIEAGGTSGFNSTLE